MLNFMIHMVLQVCVRAHAGAADARCPEPVPRHQVLQEGPKLKIPKPAPPHAIHAYIHIYIHTCIYIYTYIYIHMFFYLCMCVCTQRFQSSSFLVMTYFLLRDFNIQSKKELLWSLWVSTYMYYMCTCTRGILISWARPARCF